jgi:hypothetical protein
MPPTKRSILVTGDLILDRHVYEGDRFGLHDRSPRGTYLKDEAGGAALTHRLIEAAFAAEAGEAADPKAQRKALAMTPRCRLACRVPKVGAWPEHLTGFAWWSPQPGVGKSKDSFWRVFRASGYGSLPGADARAANVLLPADGVPAHPDIVVLDDAGDGFRRKAHKALWGLPEGRGALPRWIVLKLAGPIKEGDLWDHLERHCEPGKRLVLLASAYRFRQDNVRLSLGLSWERTVEHLRDELATNPVIRPLLMARHLIITFEQDAAVWIDSSRPEAPQVRIVYDTEHAEGEWASGIQGGAFGYQVCLAAAVTHTLATMKNLNAEPDLFGAIERGLSAMRTLRERGHGVAVTDKGDVKRGDGYPTPVLAAEILHPTHRFARAIVPWDAPGLSDWSILAELQTPPPPVRPLYGFARQLALRGESVLEHVPHFHVGKLLTVDRGEMEALRSLQRILLAYRAAGPGGKPLSIGVFGAPGSGKSFAVEQLANGIFGAAEAKGKAYDGWLEFNLSQFSTPADLIGAFHQIRDRVLQGLVPVVFFDEFDARQHQWLQYLLAPMQDGKFQEGPVTHTIGKCVFIFAGGTATTIEEFGPKAGVAEAEAQFRLAKGPDFKSRLDGYLNVLGLNPRDVQDIFFPIRRALFLRSLLRCGPKERLDIDSGLLTALLEIPAYQHGARSLGKVLERFVAERKLKPHAPLRRSLLPAPNQLALHVDADAFHALCSRDRAFQADDVIEKLAPAVHEAWRQIAREEHWTPRYDQPFAKLPADIKRSNDAAARRIPDILALVGLQVTPGPADPDEDARVREQLARHMEALAEEEHKGWMAHLHAEGWQFAQTREDKKRLHNCLRPFHELGEPDKEKDRNSVRHFPDFVKLAGFRIVFG